MRLLLAAATACLAVSGMVRGDVLSPFSLAARLEARIASGDGITLPDAELEIVRHAGTVDLARGEWPEAFRARAGETVCVAVSPFTGCYEFFDESGAVFWTVVPVSPTTDNWVAPFRHAEAGPKPDDGLYAPWRLVDVWKLSHAESAESAELLGGTCSSSAPNAAAGGFERAHRALGTAAAGGLRTVAGQPSNTLAFTAFALDTTNLFFAASWPTNDALPGNVLDLYGSTNLSSRWTFLSSHPATNPPVCFSVAPAAFPWHVAPTSHVHDATCSSVTNFVVSPLDGVTVYTNEFWSCATNLLPGDIGFFRLGTRFDGDGDGLFDALELLVYGTSTNAFDTDGDGAPDGADPAVWALTHPMWATNAETADLIVDLIAPANAGATVSVGNLSAPLSAAPLRFSLPPGQVVSCFVDFSSQFLILWCGTSGGSFSGTPESFEKPVWTRGMESFAGRRESAGWCEVAVPVLTAEPAFHEPLRSGLVLAGGNHFASDGSVCVHEADGIQRFPWNVLPAVAAAGRTPFATGAVRLADGIPYIDVSDAVGMQSGTFGFAPGTPTGAAGTLWGTLATTLSAHRCDACPDNPFCSRCLCYIPLDAYLSVSKNPLTLKHDNQATLSIEHPHSPPGSTFAEGRIEIRRAGTTDEWETLGMESDLDPWTARIAGNFELRGVSSVDGCEFTTATVTVEVQFPTVGQIAADQNVVAAADAAWAATTNACTQIPNLRQEFGFAIRLNTTNDTYVCDELWEGSLTHPWEAGEIFVPVEPYNDPEDPGPTDPGAVYLVADFHTHTSPAYWPEYMGPKQVGPSDIDKQTALGRQIPGLVFDYLPVDEEDDTIPVGHPVSAPATLYVTFPPFRRPTP